ncbi:MAG: NADP oxidoreductase [Candidatus Competibacter sp.]|nr:NADP oxidoreductase [Candidatus Competibacter sp.]MDG4606009.1 NADP oxidoreductase [Candidatus Contendobacter sp.]HRD49577.1 NADP oxidoreductase [Candidatus Contendobacter sp.]
MTEPRLKVATCSLAGCFGCHMSLLDLDERLFDLAERVDLDRSPLTDVKELGECDVGIIEGGVCNVENVHTLMEFRARCKVLIAMGACALNGGIPAMRNQFVLKDCLEESYLRGIGLVNPQIPNDPEIPLLLNRVHPIHEVVKIDYFLPGCPPSADTIWTFVSQLLSGQPITLPYTQIHYD